MDSSSTIAFLLLAITFSLGLWFCIFRFIFGFGPLRACYYWFRRPPNCKDIGIREWKHYFKEAQEEELYPPSLTTGIINWILILPDKRKEHLKHRAYNDAKEFRSQEKA